MMDSALLLAEVMASFVRDGRAVKNRRRNEMIAVLKEKRGECLLIYVFLDERSRGVDVLYVVRLSLGSRTRKGGIRLIKWRACMGETSRCKTNLKTTSFDLQMKCLLDIVLSVRSTKPFIPHPPD